MDGELLDYDDERFESAWEATMQATLLQLQSAFAGQRPVVIELVAGSGAVPSAVREGQRALCRSAARQWAKHGITVEWHEP
jgi:hypothetical protein